MSVLKIVTWPDPVLARPCDPVERIGAEVRVLAANTLETMYAAEGRGLAAPQVGVALRLFTMDTEWTEHAVAPMVCINPEIIWASEETASVEEGCLSIPGVVARVTRPAEIELCWTDIDGVPKQARLSGIAAICAQHELDHLDGIVTLDRVDRDTRLALIEELSA